LDINTKKSRNIPHQICKIHTVRNINFAVAGYPDGYITDLITKLAQDSLSFQKLRENFIAEFLPYLKTDLNFTRLSEPDYFKSRFLTGDICQIDFFGFENNQEIFTATFFDVDSNFSNTVKIKDSTVSRYIEILGMRDHIDQIQNPDDICKSPEKTLLHLIECLIEYERTFHPLEIGLPIDLMYVTRDGVHWIRKQQICN
jgi:hypothetical protein